MLKNTRILLILAYLVAAIGTSSAQTELPKMALVDMQKIFKEYHRTVDSQSKFNTEYARIQKEINQRGEAINAMQRMMRKLDAQIKAEGTSDEDKAKMSEEGRMLAQQTEIMERRLKGFSEQERFKVAQMKASSMRGIMQEINQKVVEHAEQQGFDLVFDKSGKNTNQVPFIIFIRDAKDITAAILMELNKFAPGADGK